jgi:hypothetical protein
LLGLAFFGDRKMHSVQMSPAFSFTATAPDKEVIGSPDYLSYRGGV